MKIKMLNEENDSIAVIESGIVEKNGRKIDHGVIIPFHRLDGCDRASRAVDASRQTLRAKLGKMPTSEEIVAGIVAGEGGNDPKFFEAID